MDAAGKANEDRPVAGILFILLGMFCISINDMLIKRLSGDYPLHQMVFVRSAIGIMFSLVILQLEGGWRLLRTDRPWLHALRGVLIVAANMCYFAALAVLPLADATALFFVAPLFITLLAVPFLGEPVGARRLLAVLVGLLGVAVMTRPFGDPGVPMAVMLLPVLAALLYAGMQILTRRLGAASRASALAIYIQGAFIAISLMFWAAAGDGRHAQGVTNESLLFLLRAWSWPAPADQPLFLILGALSAVVSYALSQAYRVASAAVVAPYEYAAMPLAVLWGWVAFGQLPDGWGVVGIGLITFAGIYVFLRERRRDRPVASRRPVRRW